MSSSVFFKFKSQKEPTRVEFDGTTITVFELKRDIILKSGLGDGTDFDLAIYTEDGGEEYDDDTALVPRSTTVVARRLPALKPGHGRAARYVSGKMPIHSKNSSRKEQVAKPVAKAPTSTISHLGNPVSTEEEADAFFQMQNQQWTAQAEEMAHKTPVFKPGTKKPVNVPDHEPPNGYICYRCGEKGHWIQLCPTNDNPEYDNRPRVKRTTGIPKSFLRTVDKATALSQLGGTDDDTKVPSGIMVNADGDFVIAEPDKASWEQFQAKTKSSASAQRAASLDTKELEERGLLCPIDKKMFIEPMKTPCCEKTYCNDCITNALIESDFICPNCGTDGVLIDDLKADDKAEAKLKEFVDEKAAGQNGSGDKAENPSGAKSPAPKEEDTGDQPKVEKAPADEKAKIKSPSPAAAAELASIPKSPDLKTAKSPSPSDASKAPAPLNADEQKQKKRPADDIAENPKIPKAPKAMQTAQEAQQQQQQQQMQAAMMQQMMGGMPGMDGMNGMNGVNGMNPMAGMPGMGGFGNMPMMMPPFPGMPMANNMPMGMPPMPNMNMNMGMNMMNGPPMMNPMMGMPGFNMGNNMGNNMNGGMNGDFNPMAGNNNNNNNGGMWEMGNGGPMMNGGGPMNGGQGMNGGGAFGQQQNRRPNFPQGNDEENAYFRKPVNPHRHQNRQRRVRPTDYRELGS